jgi:MOSC domain-containing protein YiiM
MVTVLGSTYTRDDCLGTLRALGPWWQQLLESREPATETLGTVLRRQQSVLGDLLASVGGDDVPDVSLADLSTRAAKAVATAGWNDDVETAVASALSQSLSALRVAGVMLRRAGALPARSIGEITGVHVSGGGVPKHPVPEALVTERGLEGDDQAARQHHGRPWQAVCVWSSEVIDDLAREGHAVRPGACGENLTVTGIDWAGVRSGVRLLAGQALLEVSVFTLPCSKNARWFLEGDFNRMHHDRGPVSRVYASVLAGGWVRPGDEVVLEPE